MKQMLLEVPVVHFSSFIFSNSIAFDALQIDKWHLNLSQC